MTVRLFTFGVFALAFANPNDQTQIEKYADKFKTYQLEVPGNQPITIIETGPNLQNSRNQWENISLNSKRRKDDLEIKNIMTDIIHDTDGKPRCYGPSCHEALEYSDEKQEALEEYLADNLDKIKDNKEFSKDRLQAINALAAKLKKNKFKPDRFSSMDNGDEDSRKVYTTWNRLKVKQHKHPYDDKDGWVTLEPVAWSTSKISKWKPNVKKQQKPNNWEEDDNRFPQDDGFMSNHGLENPYSYPTKRPTMSRPTYINNKLHTSTDYDTDLPRPTWNKPQSTYNYPTSWSPDESRRPNKHCDNDENYPSDEAVFYGMSDSVVTDHRPSNYPYEYEALHQASFQRRPLKRPTQVVYAGSPELDSDRTSRPPYGDGQWVLLSTTKGYRNKKRQRSLNPTASEVPDSPTLTSHQAIALTVLPMNNAHNNMTTSHGGLLEVEKSFQTVEESKQDMDKKIDLDVVETEMKPLVNRVIKNKIVSNVSPDSSTLLAAVGAGMVPATMAMVVPMMLGKKRRRRDLIGIPEDLHIDNILYRLQ